MSPALGVVWSASWTTTMTTQKSASYGHHERTEFKTYNEYLSHLEKHHGRLELRTLRAAIAENSLSPWLQDLVGKKNTVDLVRHYEDKRTSSTRYSSKTSEELRHDLSWQDTSVQSQVIIVHWPFPTWTIDALGLALDIAPDIWRYLQGQFGRGSSIPRRAWVWSTSILDISGHVLLSLPEIPGKRHRTCECCLQDKNNHGPLRHKMAILQAFYFPSQSSSAGVIFRSWYSQNCPRMQFAAKSP